MNTKKRPAARKKGNSNDKPPEARTERDSVALSELFFKIKDELANKAKADKFTGVVDFSAELKSIHIDQQGVLRIFSGNDTSQTSTTLKLATRFHFENIDTETD